MRLAAMVTASASFPPLVGPITLRVRGEETYWHAGDGGLYENKGIESLLFVFLNQLQEKKARRMLILAFDSSFPFSVGDRRLNRRAEPFSLLTFDLSRIPSIMEERATTYQALFFNTLQFEEVFPNRDTARVILLRHIDAEWRADLSDLPEACRGETPPLRTPADVVERVAQIPTRFYIPSKCDRELLATAATKVLEQQRADILEFLDRPSAPGAHPLMAQRRWTQLEPRTPRSEHQLEQPLQGAPQVSARPSSARPRCDRAMASGAWRRSRARSRPPPRTPASLPRRACPSPPRSRS